MLSKNADFQRCGVRPHCFVNKYAAWLFCMIPLGYYPGPTLINNAIRPVLHPKSSFKGMHCDFKVLSWFVGFCFEKAANVSLSPRRLERYLFGLFGKVIKRYFVKTGINLICPLSSINVVFPPTLSQKGNALFMKSSVCIFR